MTSNSSALRKRRWFRVEEMRLLLPFARLLGISSIAPSSAASYSALSCWDSYRPRARPPSSRHIYFETEFHDESIFYNVMGFGLWQRYAQSLIGQLNH